MPKILIDTDRLRTSFTCALTSDKLHGPTVNSAVRAFDAALAALEPETDINLRARCIELILKAGDHALDCRAEQLGLKRKGV